ncbi:hypothetical protein G6113_004898, partial [Salmonella enterica]|nr:hypothetical protein [Salmonella enterica]
TALVFLAGPPDATNTTVSTDKSAANADKKENITVTLTPRDSNNNVVPLWTFRKDLTIVPSVNATVPGAVTVTTPAQDASGIVTATLKYVDTSGQLLSKAARTGTTTIAIGKAVKQTVDTRFYPQVHVCVSNLSASGYIVPGTTEVQICDGSNHAVPTGSGYTVTRPGMSSAGCSTSGGGVCPPDRAGIKADFTGLTGDDIAQLVFHPTPYDIADTIANVTYKSNGPGGYVVYYGELASHHGYSPLGGAQGTDIFHTEDARKFCESAPGYADSRYEFDETLATGATAGGSTSASPPMKSLFIGRITAAIHTGGDTNPELFVGGLPGVLRYVNGHNTEGEEDFDQRPGATIPRWLVMVNGKRNAAVEFDGGCDDCVSLTWDRKTNKDELTFGHELTRRTGWNLSDMYYVNNWPGAPLTQHKADGNDNVNLFVTQVNYVSGYVCVASLD